jgi:hypothetical protein
MTHASPIYPRILTVRTDTVVQSIFRLENQDNDLPAFLDALQLQSNIFLSLISQLFSDKFDQTLKICALVAVEIVSQ